MKDPAPPVRTYTRRQFLTWGGAALLSSCALAMSGPLYATRIEPEWVEVRQVTLHLPALAPAHEGLRLVQLTDLHLGPVVRADYLRRVIAMTNAQHPDLIVLTGDFVTRSATYGREIAAILAALQAPHGCFAVLGNHDVWTNADFIAACLTEVGITVLRNAAVQLHPQGTPLWLLGIEDAGALECTAQGLEPFPWREQRAAATHMLQELPPDQARILLVHNPDFVTLLPEERCDLVLAGHTHGGQVYLPGLGAPIVPSCHGQKYVAGWVPGSPPVYVSRGIGLIAPAVRFLCRPELSVLQLRRS